MPEETKKSVFEVLSAINVNEHTEKKNNLTYLSWAWAWGITKKTCPTANYKVNYFDGKPYLYDETLGYLVSTEVTIDGETIPMQLPVMDGSNKAQKAVDYKYTVKDWRTQQIVEKTVTAATMFDINTAIMRCLTKNLAMFGLGHYIYAGEDLPEGEEKAPKDSVYVTSPKVAPSTISLEDVFNKAKKELDNAETLEDLNLAHNNIRKFKKFTPDQVEELEFSYQQLSAKFDPTK